MYGTTRIRSNGSTLVNNTSPFNLQTATGLSLLSFSASPTLWDEHVNGGSVLNSVVSSPYSDNSTAIYIGTRGDKITHFTGVISEVIVYNTVLTVAQRQKIEGYLAWKYNMNSSLVSGHPYLSARP